MRLWLGIAAVNGLLAVAFGAFGAHGLEGSVDAKRLAIFEKAVDYQMWHALALLAVGIMGDYMPGRFLKWSGLAFTIGLVLFCGSLYVIGLSGDRTLAFLAPFGGMSLIIGWALLLAAVLRRD
jgi:uncharacterized membrane protein YgdD (TMEM256/DUF423 family)